jgi:hypothetical protein
MFDFQPQKFLATKASNLEKILDEPSSKCRERSPKSTGSRMYIWLDGILKGVIYSMLT